MAARASRRCVAGCGPRSLAGSTPTTTTSYLYDKLQPIQTVAGTARTHELTGPGLDEALARTNATITQAYLTDALGSTVALVGSTGTLTSSYTYDRADPTGLNGNGWGFGVNLDLDVILPFLSGGGGSSGVNIEYLSTGPNEGWHLYGYGPASSSSVGFSLGASCQANVTWGNGGWTGLFDNYGGNLLDYGGSFFQSPGASDTGEGWQGVSLGIGGGPPVGGYGTQTNYTRWWQHQEGRSSRRATNLRGFLAFEENGVTRGSAPLAGPGNARLTDGVGFERYGLPLVA